MEPIEVQLDRRTAIVEEDDLSGRFGEAVPPAYFDNIEKFKTPDSKQLLDGNSAILLKSYLESAVQGLLFPQVVHQTAIILWLIDEGGNCWFCIEEMFKADARNTVFPRLNEIEYPNGYEKLGHPSLISAGKARIGGEILLAKDADAATYYWTISNKSGRYGIREDISAGNLQSARDLFASFGVILTPYFIKYDP